MPKQIAKLLCNNRDANLQRDLDTEQMRNMVLQAMEQRKRRLYAIDEDRDDTDDGRRPQLEMQEAIQIAETIQGLAETLTALRDRSHVTEDGGQHLEESLQDSLQKMAASLEGSSSTNNNEAVKQSLRQATESLQKSREELSFSQAFAAQGKTPRRSNLSHSSGTGAVSLGGKTPRRSNLSNPSPTPEDDDGDDDDNNANALRPISEINNVRHVIPLHPATVALPGMNRGNAIINNNPKARSNTEQSRVSALSSNNSNSTSNDTNHSNRQETAFAAATRMAGGGLQETLSRAIASLTITKDENNNVQVDPPTISTIERPSIRRSGRKSMDAAMATANDSRKSGKNSGGAKKKKKARASMGPATTLSSSTADSRQPQRRQQQQEDSRHLDVRFHKDFTDAIDRRKKIQVKTGDVNIKISAPSVKGISLNTTQTGDFRKSGSQKTAQQQEHSLESPIKSPRKKIYPKNNIKSPKQWRDTSRGRLWSRMATRGGKAEVTEEVHQQQKEGNNDRKGKTVERWTLGEKAGDLVMLNQKDTIAKFEGAKLKSINGYRPPGLTASSGSTSLSSASSEVPNNMQGMEQSLSTFSSWSSGAPHERPNNTCTPRKQSGKNVAVSSPVRIPESSSDTKKRTVPYQRSSKKASGTPPLNRRPDRRSSISVQTGQRQKPSMEPPMSALSHCSGFLNQNDQEARFPIRYRSVKSDEEKGFEIFLHDEDAEAFEPHHVRSDMTPSSTISSNSNPRSTQSTPSRRQTPPRYNSQQLRERAQGGSQRRRVERERPLASYGADPVLMNRSSCSDHSRTRAIHNNRPTSSHTTHNNSSSRSSSRQRAAPPRMRPSIDESRGSGSTMNSGGSKSQRGSAPRDVIRE